MRQRTIYIIETYSGWHLFDIQKLRNVLICPKGLQNFEQIFSNTLTDLPQLKNHLKSFIQ